MYIAYATCGRQTRHTRNVTTNAKKTMSNLNYLILLIIIASCSSYKSNYKKYDIEKGIITYSLEFPLKEKPIEKRIYFSNYGATEYFEYSNKDNRNLMPIIKIDSLEYTFLTDSLVLSSQRLPISIFEKLTKRKNSKLSNNNLKILKESDTLISNKKCKLIEFKILGTKQNGKAALWKGIPIWVKSQWEEGLYENLELIELDLNSVIPTHKKILMNYVDKD